MPGDRMTLRLSPIRAGLALARCTPLVLLLVAMPSHAQYKIAGADGRLTYTDRTPSAAEGRITALGARNAVAAPEVELPFELRQPVSRYPVTLYVSSGTC